MQLQKKLVLQAKGDTAALPTVKKIKAVLEWNTSVDLDLVACIEKKDGTTDCVFFNRLGDLNSSPYMKLSGDAGVGGVIADGGNVEELMINNLDDAKAVHLCALNYTAASRDLTNSKDTFSRYDGKITIVDEKGDGFEVPLNTDESGTVAYIAKIDNSSPTGAVLHREDTVMQGRHWVEKIPGASLVFQEG